MTSRASPSPFENWVSELQSLAAEDGCQWLISSDTDYLKTAFDTGLTPQEELDRLQRLGTWGGCGCGS